ncbi:MAG: GMC family oxidoreductase [Acidobacteriota bacterium]
MKRRDFITAVSSAVAVSTVQSRLLARQRPDYDCIIIGAGSAGCAAANRLSADPALRVLLLEAGGSDHTDPSILTPGRWASLIGSSFDWGYRTEPEPGLGGRVITFPRGKVLGGTSAINAMTYTRGHQLDFDAWRDQGNGGWGFQDVLPAFRALENNSRGASEHAGGAGPLSVSDCTDPHAAHAAFLEAASALGYAARASWDFLAPAYEDGAGYYQKNIKDGRRHSAAEAFLDPIRTRPNLRILTDVLVTRLLLDGRRVTGLEYARNGRREQVHASREVLLCGGVIDSPKLLMLSGIGPAAHLRALKLPVVVDLPGVGANLQDHLKLSIRWDGRTTLPASTVTAGLFARSQPRGIGAAGRPPDLQFYVGRGLDQPDRFVTITVSLVRPVSRGAVRLRSSDPFAAPVIRGGYLHDPADVAALVEGVRLARAFGHAAPYDTLRGEEVDPGSAVTTPDAIADFARRAADTIYHPAGTCRMGGDAHAVVDTRLRVRGIEGLRVADASIMPDVVSATTHAASVMIGARAADFVRGNG